MDEEIAKLVARYNDNQKQVVALRENLRGMFSQVGHIQSAVDSDWLAFNVTESVYLLDGGSRAIKHDFLDALPRRMKELQTALLEEQRLKKLLTKAGLDGLIK